MGIILQGMLRDAASFAALSCVRPLLAGQMPQDVALHVGVLVLTTVIAFGIALRLTRRRLLK